MDMCTISAVIPTYNCERFIGAALDSALGQTLPPHEIIVVDDGSTDNTEDVLRAYGDRITYIRTPNSGYPSVTRNVGIEVASGDYIAFLDADDVWHPSKLAEQMGVFDRSPSTQMVYCDYDLIADGSQLIRDVHPTQPCTIVDGKIVPSEHYWSDVFCQLALRCFIQTSTVILRKSVLAKVGKFDTTLLYAEDLDLWLRIAYTGEVVRLPATRSSYRLRLGSVTSTHTERFFLDNKALFAKVRKLVAADDKRSAFLRKASNLVLASILVTTAYSSSNLSRIRRSGLLCQALTYNPRMIFTEQHVWKNAVKYALGVPTWQNGELTG